MLMLATHEIPTTREMLAAALRESLEAHFDFPREGRPVEIEGEFPNLTRLRLDLSGARVDPESGPPTARGTGEALGEVAVETLSIDAHPLRYEEAGLELDLDGREVVIAFDRDASGRTVLAMRDAGWGRLDARLSEEDLRRALLAGARRAAEARNVKIDDVRLELTSRGPRAVDLNLAVKAKKLVSTTLELAARIDVNDELKATLSDVALRGQGMLASAIVPMIRPYVQAYDGRTFDLRAVALGDIRLRDVRLETDDGVRLSAEFGHA